MSYRPTAADRRLLAAFRRNPTGRQSPALQYLLAVLRRGGAAGRYVLVERRPYTEWVLGRLTGVRGEAVEIIPDQVFTDWGAAEWAVARLRWQALTGTELPA